MGFWSSFLGHAAANAINETQKETKKHNDLCYQLSDYMDELNKYLERIGCKQVYIADYGCIDTGSISIEKRRMDAIKRKVEEYKNLGGCPAYIQDLDEMDEHIGVIKYLKSVNRLDRQKEFLGLDLEFVKDDIEREIKEETSALSLVNVQGNILNTVVTKGNDLFISYDNWEESANTIKIDTAKYYSEDTVQFLEYKTISLIFTKTNIYVYSYEMDAHSQLYCNIPIGKNQKLNITSLPIPAVAGWSMVVIDDLQVLCSTDEAEKIMELYRKHNADIYLEEEMLQQKNINELSGIEFERVCQQLVEKMGFETETTKASGDGGIDLIAYNHQPLLSGKYIIQCKRYSGSVGEPIIRDLYGVITSERANKGILMTTGHFTKSAIAFADGKPIELIDGEKLNELLNSYGIAEFHSKVKEELCTIDKDINDVIFQVTHGKLDIGNLNSVIETGIMKINNLLNKVNSDAYPFSYYEDRSKVIKGDLYFIKGDLLNSYIMYSSFLNSYYLKEWLQEEPQHRNSIMSVAFNTIQICNILDLQELAQEYINEYGDMMEHELKIAKKAFEDELADIQNAVDEEDVEDYREFLKEGFEEESYGLINLCEVSFFYCNIYEILGIFNANLNNTYYRFPAVMSSTRRVTIEKGENFPKGLSGFAEWDVTNAKWNEMKKEIEKLSK